MNCLKCGGTGYTVHGKKCDCGSVEERVIIPDSIKIPQQYQSIVFSESLLPEYVDVSYKAYMRDLYRECTTCEKWFNRNILICAPPNSGKTVFAYSVIGTLYAKGVVVSDLMDIMEVRELIMAYYGDVRYSKSNIAEAKIVFIKIPQDLPVKLAETMSTIVERRVRHGVGTIFLFSGTKEDLKAQDRFGKLQALIGDGSYNSIEVKSWERKGTVNGEN